MNTIGIDFGTTFCTASWINPVTSKPEAITFYDNGKQKMPSVVYYDKDETVVGENAYSQLENSYLMKETERNKIISSIVQSVKRDMEKNGKVFLPSGRTITHENVIADILRFIRQDVQTACFNGKNIDKAIITHPVEFQSWQKDILINAGKIAGFNAVGLLQEPVAAAIGYASTVPDVGNGILVYDFGGGTFDVAYVLRDEDGNFRVPIPPEGDFFCGGNDIDRLLYDLWENETKKIFNREISETAGREDIGFIARCRRHKESLSRKEKNSFTETLPPPDFHQIALTIHRNDFNRKIMPVIEKTIQKTRSLVNKVKDAGYKIDTAVMIGGSSRIPLVYEELKKILPVEPRKVMQVDVAVALGAVISEKVKNDYTNVKKSVYCIYCGYKFTTADKICFQCRKPNVCFNVVQ